MESQEVIKKNQELRMETPSINIETHPDPVFPVKTTHSGSYARIGAGVVGSMVLLSPLLLLPGLILLVLPAEVYILGWTYDCVMELRSSGTKTSTYGPIEGTVPLELAKEQTSLSTLRYTHSRFEVLE
jgi:hypothetical protein